MMPVGHTAGTRLVKSVIVKTLVEGPVDFQTFLAATDDAAVVVAHLFGGDGPVPHTNLIEISGELAGAEIEGQVASVGAQPFVIIAIVEWMAGQQLAIDVT